MFYESLEMIVNCKIKPRNLNWGIKNSNYKATSFTN